MRTHTVLFPCAAATLAFLFLTGAPVRDGKAASRPGTTLRSGPAAHGDPGRDAATATRHEPSDPEVLRELSAGITPGASLSLTDALRAADERNLSLIATRQEVAKADARTHKALGLLLPMLQAGLTYRRADRADVVDFGRSLSEGLGPLLEALGIELPPMESNPTVISRQDNVSGTVSAVMSLVNVQSWYTLSAAHKARDLTEITVENMRQQLLMAVAQTYYVALMNRSLVGLQESQVRAAAHHLEVARHRFEAGAGLRIDVVRAETNLVEARQALLQARLALDSSRDALGVLTDAEGLPLPLDAPALPPPPPAQDFTAERRPDVRLADHTVTLRETQLDLSWAQFFPTLDLGWHANYHITEPPGLGSQERFRWNIMLSLNIPIFQYMRYGDLKEARLDLDIAHLQREDVRRTASLEARTAERDHETAVAAAAIAARQVVLAHEAMDLATAAFEAGAGSSLDVTDARRGVAGAEVNLATRLLQSQLSLLALHRAHGNDLARLATEGR
jgi:outer membrane protein TolC